MLCQADFVSSRIVWYNSTISGDKSSYNSWAKTGESRKPPTNQQSHLPKPLTEPPTGLLNNWLTDRPIHPSTHSPNHPLASWLKYYIQYLYLGYFSDEELTWNLNNSHQKLFYIFQVLINFARPLRKGKVYVFLDLQGYSLI